MEHHYVLSCLFVCGLTTSVQYVGCVSRYRQNDLCEIPILVHVIVFVGLGQTEVKR